MLSKTLTQQFYGTGGRGTTRPVLLTGAKTFHLWCPISFQLPMGFQNFVVINKIHPFKFSRETTLRSYPSLLTLNEENKFVTIGRNRYYDANDYKNYHYDSIKKVYMMIML